MIYIIFKALSFVVSAAAIVAILLTLIRKDADLGKTGALIFLLIFAASGIMTAAALLPSTGISEGFSIGLMTSMFVMTAAAGFAGLIMLTLSAILKRTR